MSLESWPVQSTARLLFLGQAGFATVARKVAVNWSATAGALSAWTWNQLSAASAAWTPLIGAAMLTAIPAGASVTVSASNGGDGPAFYQGIITADRWA